MKPESSVWCREVGFCSFAKTESPSLAEALACNSQLASKGLVALHQLRVDSLYFLLHKTASSNENSDIANHAIHFKVEACKRPLYWETTPPLTGVRIAGKKWYPLRQVGVGIFDYLERQRFADEGEESNTHAYKSVHFNTRSLVRAQPNAYQVCCGLSNQYVEQHQLEALVAKKYRDFLITTGGYGRDLAEQGMEKVDMGSVVADFFSNITWL